MNRTEFFHAARAALVLSASALAVSGVLAQSASFAAKAESLAALKASVKSGAALDPNALGSVSSDMVYTPITPCRIVDTRNAIGAFPAGTSRTYDLDGTSGPAATYAPQGGVAASCGLPYGVVYAAALNLTVTGTTSAGFLTAWGLGVQPNASVLNWATGDTLANTTIVPAVPGAGNDFNVYSSSGAHVIIDVVGYFAAPTATALDCTRVASATTAIPNNSYTAIDAVCPAGYTLTGGGSFPTEGTLGRTNMWSDGYPASSSTWRMWWDNQTGSPRSSQTWANCCRVPGR